MQNPEPHRVIAQQLRDHAAELRQAGGDEAEWYAYEMEQQADHMDPPSPASVQ